MKASSSRIFLFGAALLAAAVNPLHASTRVLNKEGVIGATSGGIAGGVIGHQSGHKVEGAIIGAVGGYLLGNNMHRQKSRTKKLERERADLRREVRQQQSSPAFEAEQRVSVRPPLTREQEQQLLLQSHRLYRTQRTGS